MLMLLSAGFWPSMRMRRCKVSTTHAFEEGDQVGLVFRPEDIHVMKKEGQW